MINPGKALFIGMAAIAALLAVLSVLSTHRPTAAQLFGCEHTYVNAKGEDTGECE
jgi:hypothetical protein